MTGLDLCRVLPGRPDTATTSIIMQSGWVSASDVEAGRQVKCDEYLAEPYTSYSALSKLYSARTPAWVEQLI
jgi:CheY-like chemotaxis protein